MWPVSDWRSDSAVESVGRQSYYFGYMDGASKTYQHEFIDEICTRCGAVPYVISGKLPGDCTNISDWLNSINAERVRQISKGYTTDNDKQYGADLLLGWAQGYMWRGETVKAAALVEAVRELWASSRKDLLALANEDCEILNYGRCMNDPNRSRNAEYLDERYCWPCRIRSVLFAEGK